jgi:ATP-binding cassette, subfamily B, bacterial PglK
MIKTFFDIFSFFENHQKRYFYFIFFILLITAFLETISVGAFLPLVSTMFQIENSEYLKIFHNVFNLEIQKDFFTFEKVLVIFALIYVIKFFFLIFCNWHNKTFEMEVGKILTKKLYKKYINLNYENFFEKNSSLMLKNITSEIRVFVAALSASIYIITEVIVLSFIMSFLLIVDFYSSIKIIFLLGVFALVIGKVFKKKLTLWGKQSQLNEGNRAKNFIQSFAGIKEIKIFNKENFFSERLKNYNNIYFNSNKKLKFIRALPKLFLEIFLIFSIVSYLFVKNTSTPNFIELLPLLGIYLAAAFRILPSINIIISQSQYLNFAKPVIKNLKSEFFEKELNVEKINSINNISFDKVIKLRNIHYDYPNKNKVFSDLNFELKKNESVGLMGESGSGKTTLVNLITGLLKPTKGDIIIDDKKLENFRLYKSKQLIGYVPQQTYLLDDTIKNNIAFGLDEKNIDENFMSKIIELVELSNLLKRSDKGLETIIGEKGIKLSGGQIQRIGIARALYIKPSLLILDEATNAIDDSTEKKIFSNLEKIKRNFTLIMIAHRKSSLLLSDRIFEVKNQNINLI